jgi:hypothetical protein
VTACPAHPAEPSVGACTRCGRFYCAKERILLDARPYCGDCGTRPDVDWLGHHYRQLEGKRSGLAWFLLFLGLGLVMSGLALAISSLDRPRGLAGGVGLIVFGGCAIAVFSGRPRARPALFLGAALATASFLLDAREWIALVPGGLLFGLAGAAWTDVRTRVFFRVPVSRRELLRHYHREGSNPLAITASRLAFVSLIIPGLGLVSLVMGVMAVTRVNKKATPPVGNLSAALGAIIFSLFTMVIWAGWLSARL